MASRNSATPNVLVIISDDQGPWALGASGNDEIVTPHLDRLAANGALLSNFFCTSPVCSPARASILTGLMPSQHGVHDHIREGHLGADAVDFIAGMPTYVERLAEVGYEGGLSGKWHLGASDQPRPGLEHWYALLGGMSDYHRAPMIRDGVVNEEDGYVTDLIADDAIAFLEQNATTDRPFCLTTAFTAPHSPWVGQHPATYTQMYADCEFRSCPQQPPHPWGPSSLHPDMRQAVASPRESLIGYFASVTAMDDAIGRLLGKLDQLGLRESTLVVFLSDNGFNCGHHGIWGKGNGTFPQNVYEESVRVPAIARFPGRIPPGQTAEGLVSAYDVLPTVLDFCGVENPDGAAALPGRSLRSMLTTSTASPHDFVVVHSEYGPVRMVRTDEWKYARRYPFGPDELYHLSEDPGETVNLVDDLARTAVVKELRLELERWFEMHSRPWADGSRLPITGAGQRTRVGSTGNGDEAFYPPSAASLPRIDLRYFPSKDSNGQPYP